MRWIFRNARRHRTAIRFGEPAEAVAASLSAHLHTDFPSPKGQLVVAGRMFESDAIDVRLRVFPNGARAGTLYGHTQSDWMKPAAIGTLVNQDNGTSELSYRLGAIGIPVSIGTGCLAVIGLLCALVFAATGHGQSSVIALIVTAWLGAGVALLVRQADQGIREERLIFEWLVTTLKPFLK